MIPIDTNALDEALTRAGDGVCVVASDGRIVLWNRAAERILGYAAREVTGRPCCDVFVGRDEHGNRLCHQGCHVMTLVRLQEPVQHFDMLAHAKGGRPVWLDVSIVTLPAAHGSAGATTGDQAWPRHGGHRASGSSNGVLLMHVFHDVTTNRELLEMVRERFAAPVSADEEAASEGALTRRELEVLRLVAQGGNTKAIAEKLHVSRATARNHVQNILGKLGTHSRLGAVAWAHRNRLL